LLSASAGVAPPASVTPIAARAEPPASPPIKEESAPEPARVAAEEMQPFELSPPDEEPEKQPEEPELQVVGPRGTISADDPDVGAVYDDDEEDEIEVGADGTIKRRRRKRIQILAWTKSAFARKLFRHAWILMAGLLVFGAVEGYFFLRSWRAAREQSRQKEEALAAERARLEAAKPKLGKAPAVPRGHLVLKISPPGATVWLDGRESGTAPSTMLTQPGAHRLVITAPGYRMLRDVVDTSQGTLFEREMVPAVFPSTGSVGMNVACTTEGKYPVFVDGKEIGAFCPIAGIRLDPGKHMVGLFVIPDNRIWTLDREIIAERPHLVHFNY
jgi:hypothetical protein